MTSLRTLAPTASAFLVLCAATSRLGAQGPISGTVTNEQGAPLADALVVLDPDAVGPRVRTGLDGLFRFVRVAAGRHTLRVVRIGYRARDTVVAMTTERIEVSIALTRVSILDTVQVLTTVTGIRGIVVRNADKNPIADASITVPNGQLNAKTAANGTFELPDAREGAYVLYVKAGGFLPRMVSVQVPATGGADVRIDMTQMGAVGTKRMAQPLAEFDTRVRFAVSSNSALIPRIELLGHERESIRTALNFSISFLRKGLYLRGVPCIFVDGVFQPGVTLDSYDVSEIEAIEVYGARADWTGTLADRSNSMCSESAGKPQPGVRRRNGAPNGIVAAVVLWLKHSP